MKDMKEMLQAAQDAAQRVQKQMEETQTKLDQLEVTGEAGAGLVKVRASAKGRVLAVSIDDSLFKAQEKQILEDLIVAAFNNAREKADVKAGEEMKNITGGIEMPPGFKLPF